MQKKYFLLLLIFTCIVQIIYAQKQQEFLFFNSFSKNFFPSEIKIDSISNLLVYFEINVKKQKISYLSVISVDSSVYYFLKPILNSSVQFLSKPFSDAYMFQLIIVAKKDFDMANLPKLNHLSYKDLNRGKKCILLPT